MADDKKQLLPPTNKKKKRKRKKTAASAAPQKTQEKLKLPETSQAASLSSKYQPEDSPDQLQGKSRKDSEWPGGGGIRNTGHPQDPLLLLTMRNKANNSGELAAWEHVEEELGAEARESLRWEGVLADRHAEEKRLELYRAKRRQRYIAHREAEARAVKLS
ncbi:protein LIAT1-like [Thalassophryne amazonica]|uniref:protein LIAT1-like n=1 Tax=Thalassophryne amazonica TaxID=390379 RepID=UPI0014721C4D|nr:protein LIAT1-like [Thalassophryne amazonica]XP_034034044.1 protein LIAT1-like [Thalassophryne amazonica]XP_034034045.1 protein LIAT1-like [Thalassophryne amazonica]